jgi:hypothetical protein
LAGWSASACGLAFIFLGNHFQHRKGLLQRFIRLDTRDGGLGFAVLRVDKTLFVAPQKKPFQ